jgi:hypothetical protein
VRPPPRARLTRGTGLGGEAGDGPDDAGGDPSAPSAAGGAPGPVGRAGQDGVPGVAGELADLRHDGLQQAGGGTDVLGGEGLDGDPELVELGEGGAGGAAVRAGSLVVRAARAQGRPRPAPAGQCAAS